MGRPTRTDLLAIIGTLQTVFGKIDSAAGDRNSNRAAHIAAMTKFGHQLCVDARSFDSPEAGDKSPWAIIKPPNLSEIC